MQRSNVILGHAGQLRRLRAYLLFFIFLFQWAVSLMHHAEFCCGAHCNSHLDAGHCADSDRSGFHGPSDPITAHHDVSNCPICHHAVTHASLLLTAEIALSTIAIVSGPVSIISSFFPSNSKGTASSRSPPVLPFS